ncbi:MAG: glycosyltransferase family 4 protein [Acidobacteria bacterium]|nr:glycosyltransferase family 4 protein [Acidobacteriota bacterium]
MRLAVKFSPPQGRGGGSQHTFALNLVAALHRRHSDLVLYSDYPELAGGNGLVVRSHGCPWQHTRPWKLLLSWLREQAGFERRLLADGCDVLYCPFSSEALLRTRRVPQVVTVHDLIPLIFPKYFPKSSRAWKYVYAPAARHARAVIAPSEHTKQDLLRVLGVPEDKVFVVPAAYHPVVAHPGTDRPTETGRYLLYVSSSHYPYKNILGLLRAFHLIRRRFPHKLVVVGHPAPRFTPAITQAAGELELGDSLRLLSGVPDAELAALYLGADLFVYPSLYEGFGMPPLEAMSCGVPVVASARTSIPEVCGDAAHYVDAADPEALAEAIAEGLGNQALRDRLRRAGLERVKQFTWAESARRVVEVCAAAAASR